MNNVLDILFHGVLLVFVQVVLAIASQQVDEGNYIVPRTTLELSPSTNKSAEGHKKICTSNLDCEKYVNNQCCLTISGYSKCRKRCKPRKKVGKFRSKKKGRSKNNNKHEKKKTFSMTVDTLGCVVGPDKVYKEGEIVQAKDGCNDCKCKKGEMICTERYCPPGKCPYKDKLYDDGSLLVLLNGCKRCICQYRSWNCTSQPCVQVVKQPNSTVSILPSVVLALICSVMHFLLLT